MKKKKKVVPKGKRVMRLKKKADKALQDYHRSLQLDCECCGAPADVQHHHCPKSRSSYLRYDGRNLIALCQGCHYKHHKGDVEVSYQYRIKKAANWEQDLFKLQHIYKKWEEEELKDIIKSYG